MSISDVNWGRLNWRRLNTINVLESCAAVNKSSQTLTLFVQNKRREYLSLERYSANFSLLVLELDSIQNKDIHQHVCNSTLVQGWVPSLFNVI